MIPRPLDLDGTAAAVDDTPVKHETKFVLDSGSLHLVRRWVESRCRPHPLYPASIVRSIYFDTRTWRSLGEKSNGDFSKMKVRLRWYADFHTAEPEDVVHVEAKFKRGGRRGKLRIPVAAAGRSLSRCDLDVAALPDVASLLRARGVVAAGLLHPAFRIDYRRLRYVEPLSGDGLSLDYRICVPWANRRMIRRHDPRCLERCVLELKGSTTELPSSLRFLTRLGCRKRSFSKYLACHGRLSDGAP
jgi:hypothetical protein